MSTSLRALNCLHGMQWSTELPVAGSSFTYVMASLGQLPAFLVTANMVHPVAQYALAQCILSLIETPAVIPDELTISLPGL